jgi:LuxR family maltose regulon positive regulatory protein
MRKNIKKEYFSERIKSSMSEVLDYPLTILEAPMGYGKTTSVKEQLMQYDVNVIWLSIYDNSLSSFWNGFCQLLSNSNESASIDLLKLEMPNDSVSRMTALNIIENIEFPENLIIVIDDYHLVECTETNKLLEFFIKSEVLELHFVLTVRYTNFQNLEELKLKGYLLHIEKETFEFSPKDIIGYYKQCGISLKNKEAEELYNFTEGWISALYLLMLNFMDEGSFSHTTNIYKLIEKAVYMPFSQEIKDFLITMCIFDSFTLEQATYIWGSENTEKFLFEIINKNAFVKYNVKTKTYQMHNIFTNFLKEVLESKNIKLDLFQKAAHWFLKVGDYRLAKHYFYLCGDFDNLYVVFEKEKVAGINYEDEKEPIKKYLLECPAAVKAKHHFILIVLACRAYKFNEIELFRKTCGEFIHNVENDKSLNEYNKNRLLGEYSLLMTFTYYNDIQKMSLHHKKACELLQEPSLLLQWNGIWTFSSPSILYMFYRESGRLEETLNVMDEAIPYYSQATNGNATGGEYVMRAEAHFYKGDIENAQILIHKAIYKAQSKKQVSNIICAMFLEMRIALIKINFKDFLNILNKMHEEITVTREYLLIHTIEICEGYIYSLLNQSHKISKWLKEGDYSSNHLLFPIYGFLNIVYGRSLLISGEYLKLIGIMEKFIGITSVFPNLLGHIYTYIYTAAANKQIFRQGEALVLLKRALDIAMPDKVYMPFVENCDYIKPLLEEIYIQGDHREDISIIIELYSSYQKAVERIIKENFAENKPVLTKREMEIAKLAAEGFSNKEIGESLFISQNTVKTQLKSVFEKLEINSRVLLKQYFDEKNE